MNTYGTQSIFEIYQVEPEELNVPERKRLLRIVAERLNKLAKHGFNQMSDGIAGEMWSQRKEDYKTLKEMINNG